MGSMEITFMQSTQTDLLSVKAYFSYGISAFDRLIGCIINYTEI